MITVKEYIRISIKAIFEGHAPRYNVNGDMAYNMIQYVVFILYMILIL